MAGQTIKEGRGASIAAPEAAYFAFASMVAAATIDVACRVLPYRKEKIEKRDKQ